VPRLRRVLLLSIAALFVGAPARAATPTPTPSPGVAASQGQDQVVLTGRVLVPRGTTVGDVVVFHGRAQIDGVALGDVVVLDGPIAVSGQVSGSVIALDDDVALAGTAVVGRDVTAGGTVSIAEGARITGTVRQHVSFTFKRWVDAFRFLTWLAVSVSTLLLGLFLLLLAPRGLDRALHAASTATWASIGWGIGVVVGLPVIGVLLLVTILGLPLGLVLLLGLALLYFVGYAIASYLLGRAIVRERGRSLAFLCGWAILRAVGLIPWVSGALFGPAAVFGLGTATVAIWRARGKDAGRHRSGYLPAPPTVPPPA